MTPQDFDFLAQLLRQRSGLVLTPDKSYLIESRLAPVARREGMNSVDDLIATIRARRDERIVWSIVDAMTTNETFFFRDKAPFDLLRDVVLPDLTSKRGGGGKLRVWCAAASTGQEPYSIAMTIDQAPQILKGAMVEIVGTDISPRVLEKAKSGLYSQFEVQRGLPIQLLMRYFDKIDESWRLKDSIRSTVQYRTQNLLEDFRGLGKFDVIFCRNVLIYFDGASKTNVLERLAQQLNDDGALILGAAETVMGITDAFRAASGHRGLYLRNPGWRRAA